MLDKEGISGVLVEAVERYVKSEPYPTVEVICAILGIERSENACMDIFVPTAETI